MSRVQYSSIAHHFFRCPGNSLFVVWLVWTSRYRRHILFICICFTFYQFFFYYSPCLMCQVNSWTDNGWISTTIKKIHALYLLYHKIRGCRNRVVLFFYLVEKNSLIESRTSQLRILNRLILWHCWLFFVIDRNTVTVHLQNGDNDEHIEMILTR